MGNVEWHHQHIIDTTLTPLKTIGLPIGTMRGWLSPSYTTKILAHCLMTNCHSSYFSFDFQNTRNWRSWGVKHSPTFDHTMRTNWLINLLHIFSLDIWRMTADSDKNFGIDTLFQVVDPTTEVHRIIIGSSSGITIPNPKYALLITDSFNQALSPYF